MKDYLLIIRTEGSVWSDLSQEELQNHLNHGKAYIEGLVNSGKLKSANPTEKESRMVTKENGTFKDGPFNEGKELVAGYFHITAADMDEAVSIAKQNPIFDDIPTKIEVHALMPIGGN